MLAVSVSAWATAKPKEETRKRETRTIATGAALKRGSGELTINKPDEAVDQRSSLVRFEIGQDAAADATVAGPRKAPTPTGPEASPNPAP
jgi:hypothetical protein